MDKTILADSAIKAAMSGDWKNALKINRQIIKTDPQDCETLNRLAQANRALGETKKSISFYQKVLKIDKYNAIALRNVEVLKNQRSKSNSSNYNRVRLDYNQPPSTEIFLEEPGKTKLVILVNLAPASKILAISSMQKLNLSIKRKTVFVTDQEENYLGALPDDLSYRLIRFMNSGYKYECFAKSIERNNIAVLIREISRSKKLHNQPTFPIGNNEHNYLAINAPDIAVVEFDKTSQKSDVFAPKELALEEPSQDTDDDEEE